MKIFPIAFISAFLLSCSQVYANDFYIGIGGHPQKFPGSANDYVDQISKYGFDSTRIDYYWSQFETKNQVFNFANNKIDNVVKIASKRGIKSLIILGYANKFHYLGKPKKPDDFQSFGVYASESAKHLKGMGNIYEVWNEWSTFQSKDGDGQSQSSANDYFILVKTASMAVKKEDPDAKVIAGSFNPLREDEKQWVKELIDLGILKYIDGFSVHPYFFKNNGIISPRQVIDGIKQAQNELKYHAKDNMDIPMYITEIGIPSNSDFHGMKFNDKYIATYAKELIENAKSVSYIKGVWWYDLYDDGENKNYSEHNFGIIDRDMKPKAAAEMFNKLKAN